MNILFEQTDGRVVSHGTGDVVAARIGGNPLQDGWSLDAATEAGRLVAWSGTLADELFEPHPMNWMSGGRSRLDTVCTSLAGRLADLDATLCFHPHARHVLSDIPSCLAFLRDHEDGPFEIALAPASMLEPSMLDDAEDHLRRLFEALGPMCALVFLADVTVDADACRAVPLGRGCLPRDVVLELIHEHVPDETPIAVGAEAINEQLEWLEGRAATAVGDRRVDRASSGDGALQDPAPP